MKASGRNDTAVVEFTGKVQRIVKVHQFGLPDKVSCHGVMVNYPKRTLLGFNAENKKFVERVILDKIS